MILLIWLSACLVQESLIFLFLPAIPMLPCGTLMILVGPFLLRIFWYSAHTVPIALQKTLKQFPPHQKLPLRLLLGNENSLFITFFWIFLLGQFFGGKNKLKTPQNNKHYKTKQINKTNKPESWEVVNEEPLLRNNNEVKLPAKSLICPLFHDTVLPCLVWGFHEGFSYGVLKNLLSSDGLLQINGGWTPLSPVPSPSGLWFAEDLPWAWGWSLLIPC